MAPDAVPHPVEELAIACLQRMETDGEVALDGAGVDRAGNEVRDRRLRRRRSPVEVRLLSRF